MIDNWKTVGKEIVFKTPVFSLIQVEREDPRYEGKTGKFWVLEPPSWVNIVALTPDNKVVMIRQYRHGNDRVMLELPGGTIDQGESTLDAAKRELLEETGYTSQEWEQIGAIDPNPAIQNNRCFTFLAKNAVSTSEKQLDEFEDIASELVPLSRVDSLIATGEITHAVMICALTFLRLTLDAEELQTIQMIRPVEP